MIDDDYTLNEGDHMPDSWWRLADVVPLNVRHRTSQVPGLPLLAFSAEFYGRSLSVYGPRYLDLSEFTRWEPHENATPQRRAFDALTDAFPDRFSTVVDGLGGRAVWLALRLTRLTEPIADALLDQHARVLAEPAQE
jgi:hypothetical protein